MGEEIRRMADLLRSGAVMLQVARPVCATPLFKHGKETFCAKCNRPVVILKSSEEEATFAGRQVIDHLEQTILEKITEFHVAIKNERSLAPLRELGEATNTYLSALEQIRRLKSTQITVQQYCYTSHRAYVRTRTPKPFNPCI